MMRFKGNGGFDAEKIIESQMSLYYNTSGNALGGGGEGRDTLIQEGNRLEGAKWTKRFYLSKQVLDISPVSFLASTSATRA